MLTPERVVLLAILSCLAGAVLTLLTARHRILTGWLAFLVVAVSATMIIQAAGSVLISGAGQPATFWVMQRLGFALRIHVDGLTAFFLLVAALIALPAAFYSITYMRHYEGYSVARYYPYFLLFLAAMYGLVSTTDTMWFFFIFWQLMTLPGYALIRFEHRKPANIRAANKYLFMMQIACLATMAGAEVLAVGGSTIPGGGGLKYDFDSLSRNLPALLAGRSGLTTLAFGCFLVGFGIKMGMWPFGQVWLPDAHPAAPSPVSAMLSGVMIKTGVYGLMRYFLWLVPEGSRTMFPLADWGWLVVGLGTVTLFTGTMQALKQEQSKRLLAFHSIGQIGYILLASGACMVLLARPGAYAASLATVAFCGALFHTLNHALFKSLLFLDAGSLLFATGTQDLNQMGGLMRRMPLTAVTTMVASFSIAGVPLFNGFASKWSIYVATIQGGATYGVVLAVCAIVAILTSALTLASFIKFFGASFLSRTSAWVAAREAQNGPLEVGWMMQLPQLALAAACVLLGVVPSIAFRVMEGAIHSSQQGYGVVLASVEAVSAQPLSGLNVTAGQAVLAPLGLVLVVGLIFLLTMGLARLGEAKRRAAAPWLCGYATQSEPHRYSAHHFYTEIKRYFGWLGGAAHAVSEPAPGAKSESPDRSASC
jgi:hydrogenase-4 component B